MQALPLILMAVGTAFSVSGQQQAASAEAAAAETNANALRDQAATEEGRIRRMNRVEMARQRATLAKSGIAPTGTPLDQLVRNAAELEQNAINARRGLLRSADLETRTGRSALGVGRTRSLAALFAGGSAAYGQYQQSSLLRTGP